MSIRYKTCNDLLCFSVEIQKDKCAQNPILLHNIQQTINWQICNTG